jgi:hypothetical protein
MLELGDMTVVGRWPGKAMKALATVALALHPAYDAVSGLAAGAGHDKCLFMSLAVRDFLVQIGFEDATVKSCFLYVAADDLAGKQIWSVGLGAPGQEPVLGKFNGHAAVIVPSLDLLIDTTVYQAIRPQWCETVSGMVAIRYHAPSTLVIAGCPSIAGAELELRDRIVMMHWLDRPDLLWKREPDFRQKNDRRRAVTKALVEAFGSWQE